MESKRKRKCDYYRGLAGFESSAWLNMASEWWLNIETIDFIKFSFVSSPRGSFKTASACNQNYGYHPELAYLEPQGLLQMASQCNRNYDSYQQVVENMILAGF